MFTLIGGTNVHEHPYMCLMLCITPTFFLPLLRKRSHVVRGLPDSRSGYLRRGLVDSLGSEPICVDETSVSFPVRSGLPEMLVAVR